MTECTMQGKNRNKYQDNHAERGKHMERLTGKETVKNMEHLVRLLHKEWERSGRTKAEVSIDTTDKREVGEKLAAEIQERQKQLETAGDRAGRRENAVSFTVEMDKEEYKLFSTLIKVREV